MKIIIIGCGKVGFALAEELTREEHDVTVVDASAQRLQEVAEDLDALQIVGNGSSISVLMEAGVKFVSNVVRKISYPVALPFKNQRTAIGILRKIFIFRMKNPNRRITHTQTVTGLQCPKGSSALLRQP